MGSFLLDRPASHKPGLVLAIVSRNDEVDTSVDAYRQQQLRRENSRQLIQFSSVDYTGMLTVTDPGLFLQRLSQGYGKSRAFGCGLMLIKPGAEA